MTIDTNERVAAVATVFTDGDIEIVERDPFAALLPGPGAPIMLKTFVFEPADLTVVEVFVPVARVAPSPVIDRWAARIAPRLFNVHVAVIDVDDTAVIEARGSLLAEGITVDALDRTLALLLLGAAHVAESLHELLDPAPGRQCSADTIPTDPRTPEWPSTAGHPVAAPAAFAGYL